MLPMIAHAAVVREHGRTLAGPVNLTLEGKGVTIVIGPNGSGKTMLLRMLHGLERLGAGSVLWNCAKEEARRRQAFVFQTPVMMHRSVRDNIAYALTTGRTTPGQARARAEEWAERIGLGEVLNRRATTLSGGERQKLAIARALIREPEVLFLDEPSASLDGRVTREIEAILADAVRNGTRLIMSTHDMGQAHRMAGETVFMLGGRVHEVGPASAFFRQPRTVQARAFLRGDIVE